MGTASAPSLARVDPILGATLWGVILGGGLLALALPPLTAVQPQDVLLWALPVFFGTVVARLLVAALGRPGQRASLITLALGMALWAAAAALLNGDPDGPASVFPSPSEGLFLAAYLAMGAALVLDVRGRRGAAWTAWVEALIVCGAAGTVAGAAIVAPLATAFPQGGVPLLVALLYPLLDLALALLVVGQWAMGARAWSRRTLGFIAAFVIFAFADASLVLNLGSGTYEFRSLLVLLWAVALTLVAASACAPVRQITSVGRPLPTGFLMGSFLVSVVVLLARPAGPTGLLLAVPAAITSIATAARLGIALHDARRASRELRVARTDDLTGLPNRPALMHDLDARIARGQSVGFLLLDLDGFKEVNDTLGHDAGDVLIELAARRIRDALPASAQVARVGGDEFAILTPEDDPLDLLERAAQIRAAVSAPARVDGLNLRMAGSVGVTTSKPEDRQAVDVLRRADIAMYDAKLNGFGAVLFDPAQDAFSRQRLEMGEELRAAIELGQITVWYQPKVDARTFDVVGVEALVRWAHPIRGLVSPLAFLPIARRSGLMLDLSEVVVRQAVAEVSAWRRAGLKLGIALNVAPPELLGGSLLPMIYDEMARHALPPGAVTIEVTEDSFLSDPAQARELIADVRDHGLHASIDDYGTGFSSLSYIRDLPVSEIKLDRSFVANVHADEPSHLIVSSTIGMSHALGLGVVAEGVETDRVIAEVSRMGVDILQGYGLSAPMPGVQIPSWVRDWDRRPAPVG